MSIVLPPEISSPEDCLELIDELKSYASALSKSVRLTKSENPFRADHVSEATLVFLRSLPQDPQTPTALSQLCEELRVVCAEAPRTTIVLAAPATPPLRLELTRWFRQNVSPLVLITIQVNRNVLGGIVVRHGSHIYDWSFRTALLSSGRSFTETQHVR